MKAEINNENKARFFALYWGQNLLMDEELSQVEVCNQIDFEWEQWKLSLKPLSSISDEDAIEVAKIYGTFYDTKEDLEDVKDHVILALIEDDEEAYNMWDHVGFQVMSYVIDYLRSKGYALPWMGLSVEELVEAGWIKHIE